MEVPVSQHATPEEVVRSVAAGVCALIAGGLTDQQKQAQVDQLANLYAEQTNVRHPLAPLGDTPLRTRDDLRRHFGEGPVPTADRYAAVGQVHQTADPEVVVFEFSYVGSVNGRSFERPCIIVARVRDGVIVESRDYMDHIGFARVFGGLDKLAAALAAGPA
jgi:uncharacterized protein